MLALTPLAALAAATPAPSPSPAKQLDVTTVTPGITGFAFTFGLVLVAIALFLLMTRSLRRTAHNAKVRGMEVHEPARVGHGYEIPVRTPQEAEPGLLDGGNPYAEGAEGSDAADGAAAAGGERGGSAG